MGLALLGALILLLLGLLAVAVVEFYAVLTNRPPYTYFGRRLIAQYPVFAIGLLTVVAVFIGWLVGHLFAGCS